MATHKNQTIEKVLDNNMEGIERCWRIKTGPDRFGLIEHLVVSANIEEELFSIDFDLVNDKNFSLPGGIAVLTNMAVYRKSQNMWGFLAKAMITNEAGLILCADEYVIGWFTYGGGFGSQGYIEQFDITLLPKNFRNIVLGS